MALTQLNQLAIAFKKLAGKAHTNSSFGIGNEAIPSLLQVGTGTIFGEPIPSTGLPSSLYGINGTVEKIEFQLTEISAAQYLASNPGGLSGATINASGDGAPAGTFINGIHAYKLSLPSDYESNSSNPKKGTAPFTNGSVVSDSNGGLQIIPDSFAAGYAAVVYDGTSVIFPGDQDDYYLDYSTGILFIQDIVSGQPPVKVEAYLYIGKYLADPTLSYSGSFSGSFQGDGAGLTNVPASGVVGLNLTQIATTDVTASVQNSSNIFTVTSASQEVFNISDQGILSGSGANLYDIPASGIVGLNLSRVSTGSVTASVDVGATPFTIESGSLTLASVTSAGRIAVSKSINVGTPDPANPWQTDLEGSYFNNFNANTDVSTMLRFIAGLLSQSAPDASPNTRTWNNTTASFSVGNTTGKDAYMSGVLGGSSYKAARLSQEWDQSTFISSSATSSYRELQSYLISKGWLNSSETGSNVLHDVGTNPFGTGSYGVNIPSNIYNTFGTFTFNVSSGVIGTTVFSSSLGSRAFGLGNLTGPTEVTPYSVNISYTQSFSDTASITTPSVTSTYSTSSGVTYVQSSTSPSNGLYLGLITTVNPKVIPNAYQDGYFLNSQANVGGRKWGPSGTSGNVTSSIGYYRIHDAVVGLSSSQAEGFTTKSVVPSNATVGFYAPSLSTLGVQDITLAPPTVTLLNNVNITSFSATSRSLSGAPYLLTTAYTISYDTEVSKSFDPCYGASSSPISITKTDSWTSSGSVTYTPPTISVTSNGIQTSSSVAGVFPAGGSPANTRTIGTIPAIGDVAFLSSSYSFSLTVNKSNTNVSKSVQESANLSLTFRTTGENWKGTTATLDSTTLQFYDATRFGQPSDSGSMAIYSWPQATVFGSETGTTENFGGENFRIQLNDNVPTFTGDAWNTSTTYYNLGGKDLQVKPGFLVRPGGTYGYWLTDPDPSQDFKYYIRRFRRAGSVGSFTVDAGKALTPWGDTTGTDTISIAVIFESAKASGGSNCRLYDITLSNGPKTPATFNASSVGTNPFTSNNLDHYGAGGGVSGTTYTITMVTGDGMVLNGNSGTDEFYVVVRYKGNPNPITSLAVS